jgi:predicted transcriptional regulator
MMKLSEVRELLAAEVYTGDELLDVVIQFGCASDLMSDVLAFSRAGAVLMTGLATIQTVRTADIAEISAVVFVRGKKPSQDVIALAKKKHIPVLSTGYSMYEACGILYGKGLPSTMEYGAEGPQRVVQTPK